METIFHIVWLFDTFVFFFVFVFRLENWFRLFFMISDALWPDIWRNLVEYFNLLQGKANVSKKHYIEN